MEFIYQGTSHDRTIDGIFPVSNSEDAQSSFRCLILGFVNRSGSNYLGELLTRTGVFSGFDEILNDSYVKRVASERSIVSFPSYIRHLHEHQTKQRPNLWAFKASWSQIALLKRRNIIHNVIDPTLVIIKRQDVLGQAISFSIAEQTSRWTSKAGAVDQERVQVKYNGQQILSLLKNIKNSYSMLEQVASLCSVPVLEVVYEDLLDSPNTVLSQITQAVMGQKLTVEPAASELRVQRNSLNREFRERFISELNRIEWRSS